ncbi:MAG TPA: fumarylacetoacetate hydrolase family protein [Burkholderiaceae bacterium]|jgi:2-keto-4-pentenoate hydratase|nr:fumarylacetoacetate hydrolase family protein [Burkholderiaceae bacterium]
MSISNSPAPTALSDLLANAYRTCDTVSVPSELDPVGAEAAFAVQREVLAAIGSIAGGWKIGAKSADGPIQGSLLPLVGIYHGNVVLNRKQFPILGLELEIAFSFGRDFTAADAAISDSEIMASIQTMRTSIEIVSSRLIDWPKNPPLTQLADLQNHGALIVGETVDYRTEFPFLHPTLRLSLGDTVLFDGSGNNPAGDPRRLLPWLVRHCISEGMPLPVSSIVTTGSFAGIHFPEQAGMVTAEIEGLPPLRFILE